MPPKKNGVLIKGQSSLAGFFSGGRLTLAERAKDQPSPTPSASPEKKRKGSSLPSKPVTPAKPAYTGPAVEEVKEKITVTGYKPSPKSLPPNKRIYTGDTSSSDSEEGQPAMSSFAGKKGQVTIAISDSEDEMPRAAARSSAAGTSKAATKSKGSSKASTPAKSPKKSPAGSSKRKAEPVYDDNDDDDDFLDDDFSDDEDVKPVKKARTSTTAAPKSTKRASPRKSQPSKKVEDSDDSDDFIDDAKPAAKGKAKATKAKAEDAMELDDFGAPPKPEKAVPLFVLAQERKKNGPALPGSKEIPVGNPNCLAGLTLVFTGELSSLSREEATDLAKRYGAKVTTSPSSKTSYVVLGEGAGPSKLKMIEKNKLATLDEDGFLNLITKRSQGKVELDEATKKKMVEEENKIKKAAMEMQPPKGASVPENPLWTTKYAPRTVKELAGNAASVKKLQQWLHDWQKNAKADFKKPGPEKMGTSRAVLLAGPPGVGKTSSAHIIAKLEGYTPIELNASDVRSKKLIEASLKDTINNSSLDAWYQSGKVDKDVSADGVRMTDRTVLIMDEVDGMSGGDRGGLGAINALIKKTKVPIICICNDHKNQKMRTLDKTAFPLKFQKPDVRQVKQRIMTIAFREKLKIPPEVVEQLIQSAQSDIRLVINMLSTWALNKNTMSFDEGKEFGAANAKPGMHTPFTLYSAISSPGMWAPTSKKTLNDKADYYFQDHAFMPLMVQQNYINQEPASVTRLSGKERGVRLMQTITRAADSISDGDIIDSMIHSSEQHWSLMPLHGILSTVKPMQYANGGSGSFPSFTSWLGNNSKQQRLMRAAIELQARLRLVTTASRFEVREQYLPFFFPRLLRPLLDKSASTDKAVGDIIDFMDDYYLTTEDRDIILELGMGKNDYEELSKGIPTATKSAFTRKYNAANHPIAFYKATAMGAKAKVLAGAPAPDVEEAYEAEEEEVAESDAEATADDDAADISKDKFFKQKIATGKGKATAAVKGKGKGK